MVHDFATMGNAHNANHVIIAMAETAQTNSSDMKTMPTHAASAARILPIAQTGSVLNVTEIAQAHIEYWNLIEENDDVVAENA